MENKIKNIVRFYILLFSLRNDYLTMDYIEEKFKALVSHKDIDYDKLYQKITASATLYVGNIVELIEEFVDLEYVHSEDVCHCLHTKLEDAVKDKVNNRYYITQSML